MSYTNPVVSIRGCDGEPNLSQKWTSKKSTPSILCNQMRTSGNPKLEVSFWCEIFSFNRDLEADLRRRIEFVFFFLGQINIVCTIGQIFDAFHDLYQMVFVCSWALSNNATLLILYSLACYVVRSKIRNLVTHPRHKHKARAGIIATIVILVLLVVLSGTKELVQ